MIPIKQAINKKSDIIAGDFNADLTVYPYNKIIEGYQDALLETGDSYYRPTFVNNSNLIIDNSSRIIDHILYKKGKFQPYLEGDNNVLDYNLELDINIFLKIFGSDHLPIIATLKIF